MAFCPENPEKHSETVVIYLLQPIRGQDWGSEPVPFHADKGEGPDPTPTPHGGVMVTVSVSSHDTTFNLPRDKVDVEVLFQGVQS